MTGYSRPVAVYPMRQYVTGAEQKLGVFLPNEVYSQALDSVVTVCVDAIPTWQRKMLISKRRDEPHPDWWINGGRMYKAELYQETAIRNMSRELGLDLEPDRFISLGYYSVVWDTRAQEPQENGCHQLSVTMVLVLRPGEVDRIKLNEEYVDSRWVEPNEIINNPDDYHPALVQMATDLKDLLVEVKEA